MFIHQIVCASCSYIVRNLLCCLQRNETDKTAFFKCTLTNALTNKTYIQRINVSIHETCTSYAYAQLLYKFNKITNFPTTMPDSSARSCKRRRPAAAGPGLLDSSRRSICRTCWRWTSSRTFRALLTQTALLVPWLARHWQHTIVASQQNAPRELTNAAAPCSIIPMWIAIQLRCFALWPAEKSERNTGRVKRYYYWSSARINHQLIIRSSYARSPTGLLLASSPCFLVQPADWRTELCSFFLHLHRLDRPAWPGDQLAHVPKQAIVPKQFVIVHQRNLQFTSQSWLIPYL
jgi:hypothetical protein